MPKTQKNKLKHLEHNEEDERYERIKNRFEELIKKLKTCIDKHNCKAITKQNRADIIKKCKTKKKELVKCKDYLDIAKLGQQYQQCVLKNCKLEAVRIQDYTDLIKEMLGECEYHIKKYDPKYKKYINKVNKHKKELKELNKTYKIYEKLDNERFELKEKLNDLNPESDQYKKISSEIDKINNSKIVKAHETWHNKNIKLLKKVNKCFISICKHYTKTAKLQRQYDNLNLGIIN